MGTISRRKFCASAGVVAAIALLPTAARALEQRNDVDFLRGPYNLAYYYRHNEPYRIGAGMHFFHSKQHDLLQRTPLAAHAAVDERFDRQALEWVRNPPRTEPQMPYYSEYIDRAMHRLFRTIDWTHMHHEQTYDILSYRGIPWADKKRWTDRAVHYYLTMQEMGLPRSPAPLDLTLRRAGVMMKPYSTYFRNYYPNDQALFYVAHWWHPVVYEGMMIAGNGGGQEQTLRAIIDTMWREVIPRRPQRMLLSRELMPRYARLSPESANIFDNLHMLHGIAYDILAYEGWSIDQKRAEMYRVIRAMGYQPGDEKLARKFILPDPDHDPRTYPTRIGTPDGEMSRIMTEMMEEMMPMMMPQGMSAEMRQRMMAQMRLKFALGISQGEVEGSVHDAMMRLMPEMKMMRGANEPGETPQMMIETMLDGWRQKYGDMPDLPGIDMDQEPSLPPLSGRLVSR